MGFFKDLGTIAGAIAGGVIGGTVNIVGEVTDSKFIKEVGEGVFQASKRSGEIVGTFVEGTVDCATGIITDDKQKTNKGFGQMVKATSETVVGVTKGMVNAVGKGIETVEAIVEGDDKKAYEGFKSLAKVAMIGVLAVGVVDIIDGIDVIDVDGVDIDDVDNAEYSLIENDDIHHVSPHYRTLPNGNEIWVDGDGDTSVNTDGGWAQHNPDFRKQI